MKKAVFLLTCVILFALSSCKKDVFSPNSKNVLDGVEVKNDTTITVNGRDYHVDKEYVRDFFNSCQITDPNRDTDFIRRKGKR